MFRFGLIRACLVTLAAWVVMIPARVANAGEVQLSTEHFSDLVARLPPIGRESRWDAEAKQWIEETSVAEVRELCVHGKLNAEQWRELILSTKTLVSHRKWPKDRPFAYTVQTPTWLGRACQLTVSPRLPGVAPFTARSLYGGCALGNDFEREKRSYIETVILPETTKSVEFDVEVLARDHYGLEESTWSGRILLPIEVVPRTEDCQDAARIPSITESLRESIALRAGPSQAGGQNYLWMSIYPRLPVCERVQTVGLAFTVEIVGAQGVLDTQRFCLNQPCYMAPGCGVGNRCDGVSAEMIADATTFGQLSVRLRSDSEMNFKNLAVETRWDGEFTVRVSEVLKE